MNKFVKFFHELINPHCQSCSEQHDAEFELKRDEARCKSCESLQMQLATSNQLIDKLINKLVTENNENVTTAPSEPQRIIQTQKIPWSVTRQRLETQSKMRAEELKQNLVAEKNAKQPDIIKESVTNLEKELGITNASNT